MIVRTGFSLLELLGVLMIIALLTSFIAITTAQAQSRAQIEDVVSALTHFDHMMRREAIRFGKPTVLRIDQDERTISIWLLDKSLDEDGMAGGVIAGGGGTLIDRYRFPEAFTITLIRLNHETSPAWEGDIVINCSPAGTSPSYALAIADDGESKRSLLFSGLTGHVHNPEHHRDVEAIFDLLEKLHAD